MNGKAESVTEEETMLPKGKEPSLFAKYVYIVFVVSAYWLVSILMVFVNKYLLSSSEVKLDAPLFVTFFQCIVTVFCCYFLNSVSLLVPSVITFPSLRIDISLMKKVAPLSVVFICMISFNNLCLKNVGVAFYYVGRSLTTVFNVVLTYTLLHQKTSISAIFCCAIIVFGFLLGVDQEGVAGSLSWLGVFYGIAASLFVSLYAIYTKKILPDLGQDLWLLSFYNNLNSTIFFIPLLFLTGETFTVYHYAKLFNPTFWTIMIIGGVFGFMIGYLTGLQIQVTSPLTHNISGTAKACAQTVLGVIWYRDFKPILWWVSNMIVLIGTACYTRVRQLEMVQSHRESKQNKDRELETVQVKT